MDKRAQELDDERFVESHSYVLDDWRYKAFPMTTAYHSQRSGGSFYSNKFNEENDKPRKRESHHTTHRERTHRVFKIIFLASTVAVVLTVISAIIVAALLMSGNGNKSKYVLAKMEGSIINRNYSAVLSVSSSTQYLALQRELCSKLGYMVSEDSGTSGYKGCTLDSVRNGSLAVVISFFFDREDNTDDSLQSVIFNLFRPTNHSTSTHTVAGFVFRISTVSVVVASVEEGDIERPIIIAISSTGGNETFSLSPNMSGTTTILMSTTSGQLSVPMSSASVDTTDTITPMVSSGHVTSTSDLLQESTTYSMMSSESIAPTMTSLASTTLEESLEDSIVSATSSLETPMASVVSVLDSILSVTSSLETPMTSGVSVQDSIAPSTFLTEVLSSSIETPVISVDLSSSMETPVISVDLSSSMEIPVISVDLSSSMETPVISVDLSSSMETPVISVDSFSFVSATSMGTQMDSSDVKMSPTSSVIPSSSEFDLLSSEPLQLSTIYPSEYHMSSEVSMLTSDVKLTQDSDSQTTTSMIMSSQEILTLYSSMDTQMETTRLTMAVSTFPGVPEPSYNSMTTSSDKAESQTEIPSSMSYLSPDSIMPSESLTEQSSMTFVYSDSIVSTYSLSTSIDATSVQSVKYVSTTYMFDSSTNFLINLDSSLPFTASREERPLISTSIDISSFSTLFEPPSLITPSSPSTVLKTEDISPSLANPSSPLNKGVTMSIKYPDSEVTSEMVMQSEPSQNTEVLSVPDTSIVETSSSTLGSVYPPETPSPTEISLSTDNFLQSSDTAFVMEPATSSKPTEIVMSTISESPIAGMMSPAVTPSSLDSELTSLSANSGISTSIEFITSVESAIQTPSDKSEISTSGVAGVSLETDMLVSQSILSQTVYVSDTMRLSTVPPGDFTTVFSESIQSPLLYISDEYSVQFESVLLTSSLQSEDMSLSSIKSDPLSSDYSSMATISLSYELTSQPQTMDTQFSRTSFLDDYSTMTATQPYDPSTMNTMYAFTSPSVIDDYSTMTTPPLSNTELSSQASDGILSSGVLENNSSDSIITMVTESLMMSSMIDPSPSVEMLSSSVMMSTTSEPTLKMSDVIVWETEDVVLVCSIEGNYTVDTVQFTKDGAQLTGHVSEGNVDYTYTILDSKCNHSGTYQCDVTGPAHNLTATAQVTVQVMAGEPQLTVPFEIVEDRWKETSLFICEYKQGIPESQVSWTAVAENGTNLGINIATNDYVVENQPDSCSIEGTSNFYNAFTMDYNGSTVCCNVKQGQNETSTCEKIYVIEESLCEGKNGKFEHPYTCRSWITCITDVVYLNQCPEGQCYDLSSDTCVAGSGKPSSDPFSCEGRHNAYIPRPTTYPDNCHLYQRCVNGILSGEAACLGGTTLSANTTVSLCTFNYADSYCGKRAAEESSTAPTMTTLLSPSPTSIQITSTDSEQMTSLSISPTSAVSVDMSSVLVTTTPTPPGLSMEDVTVSVGEVVYLVCRLTGNVSVTTVTFSKDGTRLSGSVDDMGDEFRYNVSTTSCADSGIYTCSVVTTDGNLETTASVLVKQRAGNVSVTVPSETVEGLAEPTSVFMCTYTQGYLPLDAYWTVTLDNGPMITQPSFSNTSTTFDTTDRCNIVATMSFFHGFDISWNASTICCTIDQGGSVESDCGTIIVVPDPFSCKGKSDGYYPRRDTYPDNCEKYQRCVTEISYEYPCGAGSVFKADTTSAVCTAIESESYCAERAATEGTNGTDGSSNSTTETSTAPPSLCGCGTYEWVPTPTTYPDNCDTFYRCVHGDPVNQTCQTGSEVHFRIREDSVTCVSLNSENSYCQKVADGTIDQC